MNALRTGSLLLTTIAVGLGAGVFALYAHTVMPALAGMDDRSFIGAFQKLDTAILNPWFIGFSFVGPVLFGTVASVVNRRRPEARWLLPALALHLVVVVVTVAINVPLNDALKAAGPPEGLTDPAAVRAAFREATWQAWNLLRTVLEVTAFVLLGCALVAHGRSAARIPLPA